MKNGLAWKILLLILIVGGFCGCGSDDIGDTDGRITDSDLEGGGRIPSVTIEKIRSEAGEGRTEVWWRLNADPAPKTDLAVAVRSNGFNWVIIPKSKNNSETFNMGFFADTQIVVEPLPMVSIVGKGLVVDLEELQKRLPDESLGGHRIPADFDFPLYKVGDLSHILVEGEQLNDASAAFVSATPASGVQIAANAIIIVTFDNDPGDVTASAGTVAGAGKVRHIAGPFREGVLILSFSWTNGDGSHSLRYTVIIPDNTAPKVTGGTVKDGDEDVDPEKINADRVIEITFSEEVAGNIALQTEAGDDIGWIGSVRGNKGTLELVKGREIGNKTTYVIKGRVSDAAGNETKISITFTTRGKE